MARTRKIVPTTAALTWAEQLANWQEALAKLSTAQEVEVMGKRIRRADLKEVRATIDWLEKKVAQETTGSTSGPTLYSGRIVK